MNKNKMMKVLFKSLSIKFIFPLITLFLTLTVSFNICKASLFFINSKDEIEQGYKQQELFEKLNDPEKLLKIQQIAERLTQVSRKRVGFDYIFNLIQEDNAFSGFAGFIYVGEPLYNLVNTDDELAFIIAHEMAHSDNRDTADSIEQIYAEKYRDKQDKKISISDEMLKGNFFNRIQEYRADSQATLYLYLAGYDPEAGISVMDKFQRKYGSFPPGVEKVTGHPSHLNRKRNIEAFVKEMKYVEKFYFRDGEKYLESKNYDDATRSFTNYLAFFYNSSDGYFKRGSAYYLKAVGNNVSNKFVWDNGSKITGIPGAKGSKQIDKISLIQAMNDFEKARSLNPANAESYNYLGLINAELGKNDQALTDLKHALEINPKYCAAINNIAVIYLHESNVEAAKNYLITGISSCPDSLPINYNLGVLFQREGNIEKAKQYFNKVKY